MSTPPGTGSTNSPFLRDVHILQGDAHIPLLWLNTLLAFFSLQPPIDLLVPAGELLLPLLVVSGFCVSLQNLQLIGSGISFGLGYDIIIMDNMYVLLWDSGISDGMSCSSLGMWQRDSWGGDPVHHRNILPGSPGGHILKASNGWTWCTRRTLFPHPINTRDGS